MNKNDRKKFEALKKEMFINLLKKERGINVLKLKKKFSTLSLDNVEKCKLINDESYRIVKRERFFQGLDHRK